MRIKTSIRILMVVVGITTAATISLKKSIGEDSLKERVITEKAESTNDNSAEKTLLIAAPADVVVTGSYVHLSDITRWVIETISQEGQDRELVCIIPTVFAGCFNALFRATIISPNAP